MKDIKDDLIVTVHCYDSDMVEHMTWKQFQSNDNSLLIAPKWLVERLATPPTTTKGAKSINNHN